MISVTAPTDSALAKEFRQRTLLPAGPYLAKLYVDKQGKITKDPSHELGEQDLVGKVEITGQWRAGYQPPKIIRYPGSHAHSR